MAIRSNLARWFCYSHNQIDRCGLPIGNICMIASLHPCPNHPEILLRPGETCPKCLRSHKLRSWLIGGGILVGLFMVLCISVGLVYAYSENLFPVNLFSGKSTPTMTVTLTPSLTNTAENTQTPTQSPTSTHTPTQTRRPTRTTTPSSTMQPSAELATMTSVVTDTPQPTQAWPQSPP